MWHAWYSAKQAKQIGTSIYLSEDGKTEIEVTTVAPLENNEPFGNFDDFEYCGKVIKWLRTGRLGQKNPHKAIG